MQIVLHFSPGTCETLECQHQDYLRYTAVRYNLKPDFANQEDLVTGKTINLKDVSGNVYHSISHYKVPFVKNEKIWFSI